MAQHRETQRLAQLTAYSTLYGSVIRTAAGTATNPEIGLVGHHEHFLQFTKQNLQYPSKSQVMTMSGLPNTSITAKYIVIHPCL